MGMFSINKAIEQFDNNVDELNNLISRRPIFKPLLKEIVHIRECASEARLYDTGQILYGGAGARTFLDYFMPVLNPNEHLIYPRSLCQLFNALLYNILDDGYLRICKIEILDDIQTFHSGKRFPVLPTKNPEAKTMCFLTTEEKFGDEMADIGKNWLKRNEGMWINPQIVSFKIDWFGTIERFTDFMRLLGKKSNWKSEGFDCSVLDTLFFKEK